MRSVWCALPVLALAAAALAVPEWKADDARAAVEFALPRADEIPGVARRVDSTPRTEARSCSGWLDCYRLDGARVHADLSVSADAAEAERLCKNILSTSQTGWRKGTPSGRKIGQKAWRPRREESQVYLVMLDGRSVVRTIVDGPVVVDRAGVRRRATADDVRLAERLAARILERLRARGYTSKPAPQRSTDHAPAR